MADSRNSRDQQQQPDDDLSIPRAALNKMIKELLPNIRVANDARELILNCCTEFIHLVSSEANDICVKQNKKTISPDHILSGDLIFCIFGGFYLFFWWNGIISCQSKFIIVSSISKSQLFMAYLVCDTTVLLFSSILFYYGVFCFLSVPDMCVINAGLTF